MKIVRLFPVFFLLLLSSSLRAQPDLSPASVQSVLGKLISLGGNPASDGSELLDTIKGGSGYGSYRFISTVQYPGGTPATVRKDEISWSGNTATINYTWDCPLMISKNKSSSNFLAEEIMLIKSINKMLPGNFPDSVTHVWALKNGVRISIYRIVQNNFQDDMLGMYFTVNKKMTANKQENINRVLLRYNTLLDNINSGNLLQAYGRAAFFKILIETKNATEAATAFGPMLKKIADKDMLQAFNILMELPGNAPVATLTAGFTSEQKQLIRDYAKGVVTAFNNKQNGITPKPVYVKTTVYNIMQLYKDPASGKYIYIKGYDMANQKFTVYECGWVVDKSGRTMMSHGGKDQVVEKSFLDTKGWRAVSAGNCHTCAGSGICISSTPHSYSITEKGIYHKYEISGTTYKTTKVTCWGCGGTGILEYFL